MNPWESETNLIILHRGLDVRVHAAKFGGALIHAIPSLFRAADGLFHKLNRTIQRKESVGELFG